MKHLNIKRVTKNDYPIKGVMQIITTIFSRIFSPRGALKGILQKAILHCSYATFIINKC